MMVIDNKYSIGETVFLVTDPEQSPRLVTSIKITPGEVLMYELSKETTAVLHYDFEISAQKSVLV